MTKFLIFYAPFIVVIISIAFSFYIAPMDKEVK